MDLLNISSEEVALPDSAPTSTSDPRSRSAGSMSDEARSSKKLKQEDGITEAERITAEMIDTARTRAEEIIEEGIQDAASYLDGLQRMAGIEVSRQLGIGLVNFVSGLVKELKIREARTEVMARQQHVDQHEQQKADNRRNAIQEYRNDGGLGTYDDYDDYAEEFEYRDRDSDDDPEWEDEEADAPEPEDYPPRPIDPRTRPPPIPMVARTMYDFFYMEKRARNPIERPAEQWRVVNDEARLSYKTLADSDKRRYERERAIYNEWKTSEKAAEDIRRHRAAMAAYHQTIAEIDQRHESAMVAYRKAKAAAPPPITEATRGELLREALKQAEQELKALEGESPPEEAEGLADTSSTLLSGSQNAVAPSTT